jgi:Mce-associated membrane protein
MSTWDPPTGPILVQRGGGGRIAWAVALATVAVLLAAFALWARSTATDREAEANRLTEAATRTDNEAQQLVDRTDPDNEALSDATRTREVTTYVTSAVEATFSYDYTNLAATEQAVEEHLTGNARCTYDAVFADVKRLAPEQKIVLDTTVRDLALISLTGDDAKALVYVDQFSTRGDVNKTAAVSGQFAVQAHREDDTWQITEFDFFGQPLVTGETSPSC